MTYSNKLKDPRWQKKRLEIMSRDEFTCQMCGLTECILNVYNDKTYCEHCFIQLENQNLES